MVAIETTTSSELNQHTEYRRCHRGGAVYLAVEAVLWLLAATLAALGYRSIAVVLLLFGGVFIHPVSSVLTRTFGFPKLPESNRLPVLSTFVALTIPLGIPLIFMATVGNNPNLFFPAFAVLVGAHFLPFIYIYGMKSFAILAAVLVGVGVMFGFVYTDSYSMCGFVAGGIHALFAGINYFTTRREG
jgi:hypothetical protein